MDVAIIVAELVVVALLVRFVLRPALLELRRLRRRAALRRELEAARGAALSLDPGRRPLRVVSPYRSSERVEDGGPRTRAVQRGVSPLQCVRTEVTGLAGATRATAFPANLYAFRQELAARGASLDDLRIDHT